MENIMKRINELVDEGKAYDEAVKIAVDERPEPQEEHIWISRVDYRNGHRNHIRRD